MRQSVEICMDLREHPNDRDDYRKLFMAHDQVENVTERQMENGDYEVTPIDGDERILFERKTPGDFVGSMKKGRLDKQIAKMHDDVGPERSYLMIEGNMDAFEYMPYTKTTQASVHGYIGSLCARWQMIPLMCGDKVKLADEIVNISRKHYEPTTRIVRLNPQSNLSVKKTDFYDRALLQLDGVSTKGKNRIKAEFPTMRDLVNAEPDDLKKVEGIGAKKSQSIVNQMNGNV